MKVAQWQLLRDWVGAVTSYRRHSGLRLGPQRPIDHGATIALPVSHSENEKDDIRAAASCLKEALRQKDVAVALSLMTDDVVIVGGVGAPVAGHDAVRKLLSTELPWNYTADELPVDSTVEMLGDMAIIVSNGLAVVKPEDPTLSLPMFTVSGRTISVFRRQVDGWKLARLISLLAKAK